MGLPERDVATQLAHQGCRANGRMTRHMARHLTNGERIVGVVAGRASLWDHNGTQESAYSDAHTCAVITPLRIAIIQETGRFRRLSWVTRYWTEVASARSMHERNIVIASAVGEPKVDIHFQTVDGGDFTTFLDEATHRPGAVEMSKIRAQDVNTALVEQLERLVTLQENGYLSEAEFEAAKRKLLSEGEERCEA